MHRIIDRKIGLFLTSILLISGPLCSVMGQNLIKEGVYLQLNNTNLIVGETLRFSSFVEASKQQSASLLSQYLYVEIVNSNNQPITQFRLPLKDGRGSGEYFIHSNVPSGQYRLVAYTQWMRNFGQTYQLPLIIVNPYEEYTPQVNSKKEIPVFTSRIIYSESLIPNTINKIAYKIEGFGDDFSAKVIDASNKVITNLEPLANGIGLLSLFSQQDQEYKVVIESDEGNFFFYDLYAGTDLQTNVAIVFSKFEELILFDIEGEQREKESFKFYRADGEIVLQSEMDNRNLLLNSADLVERLYFVGYQREAGAPEWYIPYLNAQKGSVVQDTIKVLANSESHINYDVPEGNYSISVHQVFEGNAGVASSMVNKSILSSAPILASSDYDMIWTAKFELEDFLLAWFTLNPPSFEGFTFEHLPEIREGVLEGVLTSSDKNVAHVPMFYAQLGKEMVQTTYTKPNGKFYFEKLDLNGKAYLHHLMNNTTDYKIEMKSDFLASYPIYNYPDFVLDSTAIFNLQSQAIRNQINNVFEVSKSPEISSNQDRYQSFQEYDFFYKLDDYNRFKKVEEIFIEYIPAAVVRKKNGIRYIKVRIGEGLDDSSRATLILMNGVPIDAESILSYSPYKIESVGIIANHVFLGEMSFDGVVSFWTFQSNAPRAHPNEDRFFEIESRAAKEPSSLILMDNIENYSTEPNFGTHRYWNPNVQVSDHGVVDVNFLNAELPGYYQISIQGIADSGELISIVQPLEVSSVIATK